MKNIKKLEKRYEEVCHDYMKLFSEKQDFDFDWWAGDEIGGVAICGDLFFNFSDIVWDINSNQPKWKILEWYDHCLENPKKATNYYSYTKGLRL